MKRNTKKQREREENCSGVEKGREGL